VNELTPYERGRAEAWLSSVTRNPYDRNSEAEREWFIGWQNAKDERIAELEAALLWYAEQAEGCRKITPDGDIARQALDRDGGKRARAALTKSET
jgi:hypothetical protein